MSWWTQNRKKLLAGAGLLGLNMIPGVGQAVSGALGSLTGGILGGTAATGAAGAIGDAGLVAGQSALTGGELAGAAGQGGLFSAAVPEGLANTMEAALPNTGYTPSTLFNALKNGPGSGQGVGQSVSNWAGNMNKSMTPGNAQMGLMGLNMLSGGQPPPMQPPPPPRPAPVAQGPSPSIYGQSAPPGIDPMRWAMMSEEQKRLILARGTA
jgi:hypothetical protein